MSHYEQRQKELREKFGIEKLLTTSEFQFSEEKVSPHRFAEDRLTYLKRKYRMNVLAVEGMDKPSERTLADDVRVRDVIEARGSQLVTTVATYQEKPFRVWLEIRGL